MKTMFSKAILGSTIANVPNEIAGVVFDLTSKVHLWNVFEADIDSKIGGEYDIYC